MTSNEGDSKMPSNRKNRKTKKECPSARRGYRSVKHHAKVKAASAIPLHRQGLVNFLVQHMNALRLNRLQLNDKLGYKGRSGVWMVVAGLRAIPLDRIDDWADALRLTPAEREEFNTLCLHASASAASFDLYLRSLTNARAKALQTPTAAPAAPDAPSAPDVQPPVQKRVPFHG
jgi:hypothetical protein